jgi:GNAT superfamily N-acetyltransferase
MEYRHHWPAAIRLGPEHEAELKRLLLGLDRASRVNRFAGAASDAVLLEHSQCARSRAAWLGGIFVEQQLRGCVELYDLGSSGTVEAAFLVELGWRRRGLGKALLQAAKAFSADNSRTTWCSWLTTCWLEKTIFKWLP